MIKTIRAVRVYSRLNKALCYNQEDEVWEQHLSGMVSRTLLIACHAGRTKCHAKLRAWLHAPQIIWEIRKLL